MIRNKLFCCISLLVVSIHASDDDTRREKINKLIAKIDWAKLNNTIPLDSLQFSELQDCSKEYSMTPLAHAIALEDLELADRLLRAGADVEYGGFLSGSPDIRLRDGTPYGTSFCNKPLILARNNLGALRLLLSYGAKPGEVVRLLSPKSWFSAQALVLLNSNKDNEAFRMNDPSVRQIMNETLFGQTVKHLNKECAFKECGFHDYSYVSRDVFKKQLAYRAILKELCSGEIIPTEVKQKILSLYRDAYFGPSTSFNLGIKYNSTLLRQ